MQLRILFKVRRCAVKHSLRRTSLSRLQIGKVQPKIDGVLYPQKTVLEHWRCCLSTSELRLCSRWPLGLHTFCKDELNSSRALRGLWASIVLCNYYSRQRLGSLQEGDSRSLRLTEGHLRRRRKPQSHVKEHVMLLNPTSPDTSCLST